MEYSINVKKVSDRVNRSSSDDTNSLKSRRPALRNLTDKALVKNYQQGDTRAYEEIVRRHHARVYRLALLNLVDSSYAADATQEVFMRSVKGFKSFLFLAEPATWLYKTTQYVCWEYNRKNQPAMEAGYDAAGSSVESEYSNAQTAAVIRSLIATLPAKQKEVVILRIFEELSVEETARLMRCRPGTVKAHLFKALKSLRERILSNEGNANEH